MNILVSLIGSNPLPIYILCRYLELENRGEDKDILPDVDKYLFVYSDDTKVYYDSIIENLQSKDIFINSEELNLHNSQNDGFDIQSKLEKKLKEIMNNNSVDKIIINNTGGTKPMAIYSTIAVSKVCEKNNIESIECYIDNKENKIRVKSSKEEITQLCPKNKDLRYILRDIEISDILFIHDMKNHKNLNIKEKSYEEVAYGNLSKDQIKNMANIIINKHWDEYKDFFERIERIKNNINKKVNIIEDFNKLFNKDYKLDEEQLLIKDKEKFICEFIREKSNEEKFKWINEAFPILNDNMLYKSNNKANEFLKYLIGIWLEHYILIAIEEAIKTLNMEDEVKIYPSLVCKVFEEKAKPEFEIDIVLLKGYEITAITITLEDNAHITKSKAFEGLHRVDQMGGEHSKLVIVNMRDEENANYTLNEELKSFNSTFYKNSQVLDKNIVSNYEELVLKLTEILK